MIKKLIQLALCSLLPFGAISAKENLILWPQGTIEGAPEKPTETVNPERTSGIIAKRITDISLPNLNFYPTKQKGIRPTILVCPGGGYNGLAVGHEGQEVAEYFNQLGLHAAVLKYRVPKQREAAISDAQRAIRLLRHHSDKWSIDKDKIGIMGFSAGGHLAARASTQHHIKTYEAVDDIDQLNARPDFTILVYPAYMVVEEKLPPEVSVDATTPPAFLIHADNDRHSATGSLLYAIGLKKHKTPAEVHVFKDGGHGFGIRNRGDPIDMWPTLLSTWLKSLKII